MAGERLLEGRVVLITGAGSGLGRAAALQFARHGAAVAVVDIDGDRADEVADLIEDAGGEAAPLRADVSLGIACEQVVGRTLAWFERLDVLYNNATVRVPTRLVDCTEETWDATIGTNLSAAFWTCRAAIPAMLAQGGGAIINRTADIGPARDGGRVAVGAANAGIIALTEQIAAAYGPTIRANTIAPGAIDSERMRNELDDASESARGLLAQHRVLDRLGTPDDVAATAVFLASPAAAHISGAVVPVDGGLTVLR